MPIITFRDVILSNSKGLCKCLLEKGMNLEQALDKICEWIKCVEFNTSLDGVFLEKLGIDCKDKSKNKLIAILNKLILRDENILQTIANFQQLVNNINTNIGNFKDELVKVNGATGSVAGYLVDKISSKHTGNITVEDDKIMISGLIPIGTCMMISKTRLGDFDNTGKGKVGTDVFGYAVRNGQNGTLNVLGKMIKYAANPSDAGASGGADALKLTEQNIPSLEIAVSGTISDGLVNPITQTIKVNTNTLSDGSGGSTKLVRYTADLNTGSSAMTMPPLALKHSHGFNLAAKRTNANPTEISLLPSHILEIPIERIA